MSKNNRDEQQEPQPPRGVKLLRTLEGHQGNVWRVTFDPSGRTLASASGDQTVKLWDIASGKLLRTLKGHKAGVFSVAFDPSARTLASGSDDKTVRLWDVASGKLLRTLEGGRGIIKSLVFDPIDQVLAGGSDDQTVKLWDVASGKLLRTLEQHQSILLNVAFDTSGRTLACGGLDKTVKLLDVASGKLLHTLEGHEGNIYGVAFDPSGRTLASGSDDKTVRLWDVASGKLLRTLEGHTNRVGTVAFSRDGQLLASKSTDRTLRLWNCETWETVAVILETIHSDWHTSLAFHPKLPLIASVGSKPNASEAEISTVINLWELDFDVLLGEAPEVSPETKSVHHTTAKVVLVGDHSVGKSGLGYRLAHGHFKEQASTHGQQFWVLPQLSVRREDGTECEAILWDLAGQPDYRLIHALFLDDVDLALVLFDASDNRDPLHGVEFWLKHLKAGRSTRQSESSDSQSVCKMILVGAQADRGAPALTPDDLKAFCHERGISGYLSTSAKDGSGLEELVRKMGALIPWEDKPAIVTTYTFKRIKDYVLKLKENRRRKKVIVTPQALRQQLEKTDADWQFSDAQMTTAVSHLENYGYVKWLRTSKGEERILLAPELLNNLAASFVLEARRNPRGLGSLEETRLMAGDYPFPELEKLSPDERDILLDSAAALFLQHHICFRETDPLGGKSYLVFPELINLNKPQLKDEQPTEDGVAYTVSGAVENVYASLVVLLGYTETFTRTNQWRNQARYEVSNGLICGFRKEPERDGELDFVLYFGTDVGKPVRTLFEGLFESFLARRNLTAFRYEPVICNKCLQPLGRALVRERLRNGKDFAHCPECSEKLTLPKADEPIQLTQTERRKVDEQRRIANQRTRFEQAVFQLMSYVEGEKLTPPECFISYAWGDNEVERWVERNLATDLQKAGIRVVLDRWENNRAGRSVSRFVSRISECDIVIPVGTPLYFEKFKNKVSSTGSVVAAEVELISQRLLGTDSEKETVMPVLLAGSKKSSLPPLMWDRVHRDFRTDREYFITAFDFILDLYGIAQNNTAVADLRESLLNSKMR